MKKAFAPALRKFPALVPFCGVVTAWLLSSCGLLGKDLSSVKDWITGKDWTSEKQAQTYYESGIRDFQSGARQVAMDEFTKAIELDPSLTPAYDARATVRYVMKDYADAISDCDKVLGVTHDDEHVYLLKGACRYYLHDIQGALKPLNTAVSMNTNDPMARVIRGMVLTEFRDWDGAAADFSKAIELNPDDASAYYGRAAAEFFLKEYEKSLADASGCIELKDNTIAPIAAEAYGLRANVKTHLKDRAGAFADANARIKLDTSDEKGYVTRADIEILWDEFSDASNDLKMAIQNNPTNARIYLIRATLEQKCGYFQAAVADYTRGLTNDEDAFHAAFTDEEMGYALAEMGQWQRALELFRKTMSFNSPPDGARFEAFLIQSRLGQTPQARKELAAYIQSIPRAKAHDWTTSIAHYLAGTLNETDFLAQATSTAKRPTDIAMQTGDSWYYAGMVHLLAGDKAGAMERFKKSLKVGDDNSNQYMMARSLVEN